MKKNFGGVMSVVLGLSLIACASDSGEEGNDDSESADDDSSSGDDSGDGGSDDTNDDETNNEEQDSGADENGDDDSSKLDAGSSNADGDAAGLDAGTLHPGALDSAAPMSDGGHEPGDAEAPTADASGDAASRKTVCGSPIELGTYTPTDGDAAGFAMDGDVAYVAATSAGVYVVDVSDPAAPLELGQYDFPSGNLAYDVSVRESWVAVALRGKGWALLDVSDADDIRLAASDDSANARDVVLSGDTLFISDGNGVQSVDLRDPELPTPLTTDLVLPGSSRELIVDGPLVYVGSAGAGISIVDASDPAALTELSSLEVGFGSPHIAYAGGILYASHAEGVTVIDVSDPAMPSAIGEFTRGRAHALALLDQHLFLFGDDTASIQVPFVSIIDVSDPAMPVKEDADLDTFEAPIAAHVVGDRLFASVEDDDSLHIFEACPQSP